MESMPIFVRYLKDKMVKLTATNWISTCRRVVEVSRMCNLFWLFAQCLRPTINASEYKTECHRWCGRRCSQEMLTQSSHPTHRMDHVLWFELPIAPYQLRFSSDSQENRTSFERVRPVAPNVLFNGTRSDMYITYGADLTWALSQDIRYKNIEKVPSEMIQKWIVKPFTFARAPLVFSVPDWQTHEASPTFENDTFHVTALATKTLGHFLWNSRLRKSTWSQRTIRNAIEESASAAKTACSLLGSKQSH